MYLLKISGCKWENIQKPAITNFIDIIKSQHIVNCSVAVCAEFSCDITLIKNERILYNITGNVSSGWIEQTGLRAAVFHWELKHREMKEPNEPKFQLQEYVNKEMKGVGCCRS
ncbi:hypothetical protein QQF64_004147 [Cirrhinus molitorella]|uniref:Integrin alpha-X-like third Ig-like domain-containing protein n=1 Tax=Cirrhinus molitorella TaxID=172907 RepID=A0ABR3MFB5_9TELE